MADQPKPPLWRVLHTAHNEVADPFGNAALAAYAAEIRALADWLVREEDVPSSDIRWIGWMELGRLRQLLLAEADRAERGE